MNVNTKDMEEKLYKFSFTEREINVIKHALCCSGIEFCSNREVYKKLCEVVCDEDDKKMLERYE